MQANVQLKRDVEVPPSGGLWLGNENPFADIFDPADRAKGWLTAFDAETGNVRWMYHAPHPMLAGVTPTAVGLGVRCGSLRPDLRGGRGQGTILWQRNAAQSTGGGIVTYGAGGRQLIGVASGMSHRCGPGGAQQSRFLVYGLR